MNVPFVQVVIVKIIKLLLPSKLREIFDSTVNNCIARHHRPWWLLATSEG